jgi:type VI secretion system protein ImpE
MNATELFKAGRLPEAVEEQVKAVKASPADQGKRLFLFELLAFQGDLERARRQIDAVNYDEMELSVAVLEYRQLLDAEQARRKLFSDGLPPQFFGPPPEHVQLRLEALGHLREKRPAQAADALARAAEVSPPVKGTLNKKPFDSLRDYDDLFASLLEVMAHGNYYWVPLEQVDGVTMNGPRFPRDLLWIPARLELESSAGTVFLPALYPGTHEHSDPQVRLGRSVDWKETVDGPTLGSGVHVFLAGDQTVNLLDWRELVTE